MGVTVKLTDLERAHLRTVQSIIDSCADVACERCLNILAGAVAGIVQRRVSAAASWRGGQS